MIEQQEIKRQADHAVLEKGINDIMLVISRVTAVKLVPDKPFKAKNHLPGLKTWDEVRKFDLQMKDEEVKGAFVSFNECFCQCF